MTCLPALLSISHWLKRLSWPLAVNTAGDLDNGANYQF